MEKETLTPKFLPRGGVREIIRSLLRSLHMETLGQYMINEDFHIVVLGPSMRDEREADYPNWPNYQVEPTVLCEYSSGRKEIWGHKFDDIARCKALQLWHGRNDGGTDILPHLLFPGDTIWCGGVKRYGLVVSCSGFHQHIDRMVSGMICEALVAVAYDYWMGSIEREKKSDFLS